MKVQVNGFVDEVIEVDAESYRAAVADKRLEQFMLPHLEQLEIELVYTPIEGE